MALSIYSIQLFDTNTCTSRTFVDSSVRKYFCACGMFAHGSKEREREREREMPFLSHTSTLYVSYSFTKIHRLVLNKAMCNWEIYAIPCYAEFQNSDWGKSNGNKLYLRKHRITGKLKRNYGISAINGITRNYPEITKRTGNFGQNPIKFRSKDIKV